MLYHNFHYSLKVLLRSRQLVFWTLGFPLIMALFFNMAFSNIENNMTFQPIEIAVIDDDSFKNTMVFKSTLEELGTGDDRIFNITYTDAEKAKESLQNGDITGYLTFGKNDEVKVTVKSSGVNETILTSVVDEILTDSALVTKIGTAEIVKRAFSGKLDQNTDYEKLFRKIADDILDSDKGYTEYDQSNVSFVTIEFYSLIAMSCLYSSLLSMTLINFSLANISAIGKRVSVSPSRKGSMITGSFLAGFVVQLFGLAALYALMLFVIKVDFGTHLAEIILLSVVGSIAGLTMGIAVATLVTAGENVKITVLISVTMAGCFLSGMMGITMKNIVDKNVPFLNWINPVAMVTDGLYALYYYDGGQRYYISIISLAAFSAIMMLISLRGLRRQRYDYL